MAKTRLEKWEEDEWRTPIGLIGNNQEVLEFFQETQKTLESQKDENKLGLAGSSIKFAKELVFDIVGGKPKITILTYVLDSETLDLVVCPLLETVDIDDNDVKVNLMLALAYDVPVVPNSEDVAPALVRYHKDLLVNGFELDIGDGSQQYRPTKFSGVDIDSPGIIDRFTGSEVFSPAELLILKEVLLSELEAHNEAARFLANLRAAITDLEVLLEATNRNEAELQNCLTKYPILFGTEYRRVIPKHKLGSEYEMDYALEKTLGIYDLIEIEASTHHLFTKQGDPRKELVHAEQQVLDWLYWLERNSAYARENLPGIQHPIGYVIIGRSSSLSEKDKVRLRWRNSFFRGDLIILTYDDILNRAKNLLNLLEGQEAVERP